MRLGVSVLQLHMPGKTPHLIVVSLLGYTGKFDTVYERDRRDIKLSGGTSRVRSTAGLRVLSPTLLR